ncbi:nickel-dependent hydrogenase large subunit [Chloroflexota bacterium]
MSVTIPIGPQHPALKEPINFMATVDGEEIVDISVRIGYNHRGIEKGAEQRNYIQNIYLTERICGICSFVHTTTFVQGVEELLSLEIPKRGLYLRTLVLELERIHSHLLWVGVAGHEVGFDTLFMYAWRDRELVLDLLELITGNRVNYGFNAIGGVRRDLTDDMRVKALEAIKTLEERTNYYLGIAGSEVTFLNRVKGVGPLSKEMAIELCAVGPTARASGVDVDPRRDDPYAAYPYLDFKVITSDLCDVLGRTVVRALELFESCKICRQILEGLPEGDIRIKAPRRVPPNEVYSKTEAPRGELIHYIRSNGTDRPERLKVRTPTLANITSVAHSLKGGYIADIPITFAAIDPCMACMDRIILLDANSGEEKQTMSWEDLRKYSINWYKNNY